MGALPSVHRWYSEDFRGAPDWFQRFLGQLNLYSEPMYNILNAGVDFNLNTICEFYTLNIANASAMGTGNTALFTPKKFAGKPSGVILAQCLYNATTGVATAVGNPVQIDWFYTGSQISILAIYGLTASKSYTLTLLIC